MSDDGKKQYCYSNDCKIVETGFHLITFPVCSSCKKEVSQSLKKKIEERNKPKEEVAREEYDDFWGIQ